MAAIIIEARKPCQKLFVCCGGIFARFDFPRVTCNLENEVVAVMKVQFSESDLHLE